MMRRSLAFAAIAILSTVHAQEAVRPWRLRVLMWHRSPNDLSALEGLRAAFAVARRPHEIQVGEADSDTQRAIAILDGFRRDGADLIVALGTQSALLCKQHVTDLPVVFSAVTNPVESGVVVGWGGSGTNLAGNSNWIRPETVLGVFRRAVPNLGRIGVLRSHESGVVSGAEFAEMQRHLAEPRSDRPTIRVVEATVDRADQLESAVDRLAAAQCQAIWIPIDFVVYENLEPIARAAARHHLPLVSSSLRGATSGAVAGVLVDYEMLGQRAALIALDILERHRDPGTIPIGTMRGYQVVVNLSAARQLGYELPLPLLALADLVIDDAVPGEAGR